MSHIGWSTVQHWVHGLHDIIPWDYDGDIGVLVQTRYEYENLKRFINWHYIDWEEHSHMLAQTSRNNAPHRFPIDIMYFFIQTNTSQLIRWDEDLLPAWWNDRIDSKIVLPPAPCPFGKTTLQCPQHLSYFVKKRYPSANFFLFPYRPQCFYSPAFWKKFLFG